MKVKTSDLYTEIIFFCTDYRKKKFQPEIYPSISLSLPIDRRAQLQNPHCGVEKIRTVFSKVKRFSSLYTMCMFRFTHRHGRRKRAVGCRPPYMAQLSCPVRSRSRQRSWSCAVALKTNRNVDVVNAEEYSWLRTGAEGKRELSWFHATHRVR